MQISRAYKSELAPTNKQKTMFRKHLGCVRHVYNWALRERIENYNHRLAVDWIDEHMPIIIEGEQFGCWGVDSLTVYEQSRRLTQYMKREDRRWLKEVDNRAIRDALKSLDNAYKKFFKEGGGFPRFKGRSHLDSFKVSYQGTKLKGNYVKLGKIGWVRLKEGGYLPLDKHLGKSIANSVTVSRRGKKWFVSFQIEKEIGEPTNEAGNVVGIDRGVKTFAVLSDGRTYEHPNPLKTQLKKLKRLQRSMSRTRLKNGGYDKKGKAVRGWTPTKNYRKKREKLSKLYRKISDIRKDFLHQVTTDIVQRYGIIVVEGLKVKNMTRKKVGAGKAGRASNRAMLEQGWSEFLRQLKYKAQWYGSLVMVVDTYYPSSKLCSKCGTKKKNLNLNERTYKCEECGLEMDRDLNASHNLRDIGMTVATGQMETLNASGDGSSGLLEGETLETECLGETYKVELYGIPPVGGTSTVKEEPGREEEPIGPGSCDEQETRESRGGVTASPNSDLSTEEDVRKMPRSTPVKEPDMPTARIDRGGSI